MANTLNGYVVCNPDGTAITFTTAATERLSIQRLAAIAGRNDSETFWRERVAKGYTVKRCVLVVLNDEDRTK